jgi:integrase
VKHAIQFTVLTAVRSGETRVARWSELDWEGKRWIIPAERVKAAREHRVPLSGPALEILKTMCEVTGDQYLGSATFLGGAKQA